MTLSREVELEMLLDDWEKELPDRIGIAKFPHRPCGPIVDGVEIASIEAGPLQQRIFTVYSKDGTPTLLRMIAVATVPRDKFDSIASYQVMFSPDDSNETIKNNILEVANKLLAEIPAG